MVCYETHGLNGWLCVCVRVDFNRAGDGPAG